MLLGARRDAAGCFRPWVFPSDQQGVASRAAHEFQRDPSRHRDAVVTAAPIACGGCELVQRAHPPRRTRSRQGTDDLRGKGNDVPGDGRPYDRNGRGSGRSGRRPRATSWRSCRTTVRNSSRPSSPPMPSAPSPCRSTGDSPRPRCATSSSTPAHAPWSAMRHSSARQRGDGRPRGHADPGQHLAGRRQRMDAPRRPARRLHRSAAGGGVRRRRAPADVHVGHDRPAQGRHADARQPGLEEPGAHRRVRLHECRSRAGLRPALPRRRARPDDHVAHCRGRHDHCAPFVRGGGGGRRDRALPCHRRLAGARHGQRDHGPARHRAARSLVHPGGHQRRREDADPAHRAHSARLPLGLVRRCVRHDRDGLGRHLSRPRQHRHEARVGGSALPLPRARHLGRGGELGARRRAGGDRHARPQGLQGLLAGLRTRPLPRSPAAGSTRATSASATRRATSTSSTG